MLRALRMPNHSAAGASALAYEVAADQLADRAVPRLDVGAAVHRVTDLADLGLYLFPGLARDGALGPLAGHRVSACGNPAGTPADAAILERFLLYLHHYLVLLLGAAAGGVTVTLSPSQDTEPSTADSR